MAEFVPVSSKRRRLTFGRARDLVEIPDMIEVQRDSYDWFYQENTEPGLRTRQGLQELMQEIFPIESYDGSFALRVAGLRVVRRSQPSRVLERRTVLPALCIVAQGAKTVMLGRDVFSYDASRLVTRCTRSSGTPAVRASVLHVTRKLWKSRTDARRSPLPSARSLAVSLVCSAVRSAGETVARAVLRLSRFSVSTGSQRAKIGSRAWFWAMDFRVM